MESTNNSKAKVFVLCSGGLDSVVTAYKARKNHPSAEMCLVSCDYYQQHSKEILYAIYHAEKMQVEHKVIDLPRLSGALVDGSSIPDVPYSELPEGVSPAYVSFRNGLMLAAATAVAHAWCMAAKGKALLYCGNHADDAARWAYPDCTEEFMGSMASAIHTGTYGDVRLVCPFTFQTKAEIVEQGDKLNVEMGKTWSCYKGGGLHCGVCPTCRSRKEAFVIAQVKDCTEYEV